MRGLLQIWGRIRFGVRSWLLIALINGVFVSSPTWRQHVREKDTENVFHIRRRFRTYLKSCMT